MARLSLRQLAVMNGAHLEEGVIEQVAKLEAAINRLPSLIPKDDLGPILRQLAELEAALKNLPVPELPAPQILDMAPVLDRIELMRDSIAALAMAKPAVTWEFDIVRNASGKIAEVTAIPKAKSKAKTLLTA